MSHNTKQIVCHWFLDGFRPESEYYADIVQHFTAKELERIQELRGRQYNADTKFTKKEKAFIMYVLDVVMWTSKMGEEEYEHEE